MWPLGALVSLRPRILQRPAAKSGAIEPRDSGPASQSFYVSSNFKGHSAPSSPLPSQS